MKKFFYPSPNTRRIIHLIMYVLFMIIVYQTASSINSLGAMITFTCLMVIILSFALYYEYLLYLQEKMIIALNFDCDLEKTIELKNKLVKLDVFHGFKKDLIVFNSLFYLATAKPEDALNLINHEEKLFKTTIDALLIKKATIFLANVQLNNKTQAKKTYLDLVKLKDAKVKGKKVMQLYSWEYLDGLYLYMSNDFKKAEKALKSVNCSYMNPKEKAFYYYYYTKVLLALDKQTEALKTQETMHTLANTLPIGKEL